MTNSPSRAAPLQGVTSALPPRHAGTLAQPQAIPRLGHPLSPQAQHNGACRIANPHEAAVPPFPAALRAGALFSPARPLPFPQVDHVVHSTVSAADTQRLARSDLRVCKT